MVDVTKESKEVQQTTESSEAPYQFKSNKLDIYLSGLNLPRNSFCQLFQRTDFTRQNWVMFAATEVIQNNKDPVFTHPITLQYFFSVKQEILVEIRDAGTNKVEGTVGFTFGSLLNSPKQSLHLAMQKNYPSYDTEGSFIVIKTDNTTDCLDEIHLQFAASFIKSYVFTPKTLFTLWKMDPIVDKFVPIFRSEIFLGNVPNWPTIRIKIMNLCGKNFDRMLRIVVHKVAKYQQEKIMGHADFTLNDIFANSTKYDLIKISKKNDDKILKKNIGRVFVQQNEIVNVSQFVDFLIEGVDISSVIAIDFSNRGEMYNDPSSLHHYQQNQPSQYEKVAQTILEILMPYSHSKAVSCFGFGATTIDIVNDYMSGPNTECFSLSDTMESNLYSDVQTLSSEYKHIMNSLVSSKLRFVTPVLRQIIDVLKRDLFFTSNMRYYNLIFLLEREIDDLQEFIDFLVPLSNHLPLTIFLVGMGTGPYHTLSEFRISNIKRSTYYDSRGHPLDPYVINFITMEEVNGNHSILVKELLKIIPERVQMTFSRKNASPQNGGSPSGSGEEISSTTLQNDGGLIKVKPASIQPNSGDKATKQRAQTFWKSNRAK